MDLRRFLQGKFYLGGNLGSVNSIHNMRHTFLLLGLVWLVSSCATVINGSYSQVRIKSDEAVSYIYKGDTVVNKLDEPVTFVAKNSREPVIVSIFNEEKSKRVYILPKKAPVYWLNTFSPYLSGYVVDEITGKKWKYPKKVHINMDLPGNSYTPYFPMDSTLLLRRNKIGFNPFSFGLAYHPGVEISYERLHNDKFGTQLSYTHFLARDNEYARNAKGFRLNIEEKYFFRSYEQTRLYISLAAEFLHKTHDADLDFYTQTASDERFYFSERKKIEKTFYSITPHIGIQHYLSKKLVVETYFGMGLRYRKTTHSQVPNNYHYYISDWEWLDIEYYSNKQEARISGNMDLSFKLSWAF
ncbi:hypothetical protein [Roseivirga echinicomitans]|nr:hypothetical protein [Roseivirga echinicomitans]